LEAKPPLIAAIDTASDMPGVALCDGAGVVGVASWHTKMGHSREVLPTLDWLLQRHNRDKSQIDALAIDLGPGGYAGLRVGLSTAKALAYGLEAKLVGIGRLPADAWPLAQATGARIVPVQVAGRAELAYGAYHADGDALVEDLEAGLGPLTALIETLRKGDIVCGEADRLDEASRETIRNAGARILTPTTPRVLAVAYLAWQRLQQGDTDDLDALVPLYLRAPAIGPQPPPPRP
jgi:tRNA threonylcarbamoyladenosine biosynthesis protein TsaB